MTINTEELRRLHGAATAGEWAHKVCPCGHPRCDLHQLNVATDYQGTGLSVEDAAAIVALHNAAPALLDAADRLARIEAVMGSEEAVSRIMMALETMGWEDVRPEDATAALAALRELIGGV